MTDTNEASKKTWTGINAALRGSAIANGIVKQRKAEVNAVTELSKGYLALRADIGRQIESALARRRVANILVLLPEQHVEDMMQFIAAAIFKHFQTFPPMWAGKVVIPISYETLLDAARRGDGIRDFTGGRVSIDVMQKPWPNPDGYYVRHERSGYSEKYDTIYEDVTPCNSFLMYMAKEEEQQRQKKHQDDWRVFKDKDDKVCYVLDKINRIDEPLPTGAQLVALEIPLDSKVYVQRVVLISGNPRIAPLVGTLKIKGGYFIEWRTTEDTVPYTNINAINKATNDIPDEYRSYAIDHDICIGFVGEYSQLPVIDTESTRCGEILALAIPHTVYGGNLVKASDAVLYISQAPTPEAEAVWFVANVPDDLKD